MECADCESWCGRCLKNHKLRLACSSACDMFGEREAGDVREKTV